MSDFKIIETQEQFDKIMGERLGKERDKFQKLRYEVKAEASSQVAELEKKLQGMTQQAQEYAKADEQIAELTSKLKASENTSARIKAALNHGLDLSAVEFIKGETAEDIEKSAEQLKALVGTRTKLPSREPAQTNSTDDAYSSMAKQIFYKE